MVSIIWDSIFLIDDIRAGINHKLELWRETLECNSLKLSRTKTEYKCKYSSRMQSN